MADGQKDSISRQEELRQQGQIQIPMAIDPHRYFIGNIRWIDVLYTAPFALISIIIIVILTKTGNLSTPTFIFSFLPPTLALTFLWIKHPYRKNISLIKQIWWQIRYKHSQKLFEYTKEVNQELSADIRSQLGVFNISNDFIETLDNRLVKVIEVSSINITGLSDRERKKVYSNYQTFLNNLASDTFPIQTKQFSKPVHLSEYLEWAKQNAAQGENRYKRLFADSYIDKVNEIQQSKNMVSKARYVITSTKIGTNKEKAMENLNMKAEQIVTSLENMLSDKHKLYAEILDNQGLFQYIYACIDYDNAQIRASAERKYDIDLPFTMAQSSFERELANLEKQY